MVVLHYFVECPMTVSLRFHTDENVAARMSNNDAGCAVFFKHLKKNEK